VRRRGLLPSNPATKPDQKEKNMKKYLLFALIALPVAACGRPHHDGMPNRPELTAEQKECLKKQGLPEPEFKDCEKKDKEDMKKSFELRKKALEACGIKHPAHPKKDGHFNKKAKSKA
jgi:hypothetical protein